MNIDGHPIWKGVAPYKKPFHLLRINIARHYAKLFPASMFVGITGSVGKTTTVKACQAVLAKKMVTISTTENSSNTNLDPIFNIPMTILRITPKVKKVILEMGVEFQGDMDINLSFVHPQTVVFTKIAYAHSEFLGDIKDIIEEKGKLAAILPKEGVAILNWDDPNSRKIADKCKGKVFYYGLDSKNCVVWASNIKIENLKTIFELNYGVERVKVEYNLLGQHQVYPALAAATLGINEGVSLIQIKHALEKVEPEDHRLQPVAGPNGSIILDDTYNSSPSAVEAAVDTLMQIPARRHIVVLGEMRELGKYSEMLHRQIAGKIFKEKVDLVFLGQGDTVYLADELNQLGFVQERLDANLQNSQLVGNLLKTLAKGDVCLIKGSRAVRLDEVVKRVAKK